MEAGKGLCIRDLIIEGRQDPDAPAIESPGFEPLAYHELRKQIASVVRYLNARGFRPNDRIAVVMPKSPCAAVATMAVMAGFTLVPLNFQYRAPEFDWYFTSLDIRAVLVQQGAATEVVSSARKHAIPVVEIVCFRKKAGMFTLSPPGDFSGSDPLYATDDDTITLMQTSGTTAKPKIVPVTQKVLFSSTKKMNEVLEITASDRHLHILPLDTTFGLFSSLWSPLVAGGSVIIATDFIPQDFLHLLRTFRPTYYWGGPVHHTGILCELKKIPPEERAGHSLRFAATASSLINPAVIHDLEELLGVRVIEAYGMSEVLGIALSTSYRKGSVGLPIIPGLQIWDDSDHPLPPGITGEIVVRGDQVFTGYLNAPEENAAVFKGGWFRTGDIGYLDEDGYLFLAGRKKEMINKGGRKIAPAEVDAALLSHPGVRDAMAFAIRDPILGEDIGAIVVREKETLTEKDLRQYLLNRLLPSKTPQKIFFVDSIPRNPAGKPLRDQATEQYSR
jgi:acyl-CoA synthetase (AMP-forming)/AMP-acid ligase II